MSLVELRLRIHPLVYSWIDKISKTVQVSVATEKLNPDGGLIVEEGHNLKIFCHDIDDGRGGALYYL